MATRQTTTLFNPLHSSTGDSSSPLSPLPLLATPREEIFDSRARWIHADFRRDSQDEGEALNRD